MKTFFIRLDKLDFDFRDQVNATTWSWKSVIYDLYDNSAYVNFATRKANYGTDLLDNGIYTGINAINATTSEIGHIDGTYTDSFVDTAGNIDIMTWGVETYDAPFTADVKLTLNTYTSTHGTPTTEATEPFSDWSLKVSEQGQDIFAINSSRYAFWELILETEPGVDIDDVELTLYVTIEIDSSTVNGYFSKTLSLLNNFPEWMAIREIENTSQATPIDATPSSLGGQFLNAVAGEWLTDLSAKIQYEQYQHYINSVDLSIMAWAYKLDNVPKYLETIVDEDSHPLARCATLSEFYECTSDDKIFYWDRVTRRIFLTKRYDELTINGSDTIDGTLWADTQIAYHVWNCLDDIGASIDLFRLEEEFEDNDSFQKRILDVYINKPGTGMEAFKLTLRRELNLWMHMDGATPDSAYVGATPTILEIEDLERDSKYFNPDGTATNAFIDLINFLARQYPILWGFLKYNQAFWDPDGLERKGVKAINRRHDATPMEEDLLDSGVGDVNDLYLFKPQEYSVPQEFDVDLKIRGRQKSTQSEYSGLSFNVSVYGQADMEMFDPDELDGNFTLEVVTPDGTFYSNIVVSSNNQDATPSSSASSWSFVDWVTPNGLTNAFYQFYNKTTNELYVNDDATPNSGQINLLIATSVTIKPGHYNFDTTSYIDAPIQSQYKLWFMDAPGTILGLGGSGVSIIKSPYNFITATGNFIFQSQIVNYLGYVADSWVSDSFVYAIKLDGVLPDFTQQNFILNIPTINWPTGVLNKEIILRLETVSDEVYGAFTDPNAATPMFFEDSYIAVNGNNTWTDGRYKSFISTTTSVTFSSQAAVGYPINMPIWTLFEASFPNAISGTVDSNGPWRGNEAQLFGSKNEVLEYLNLSRNDFGIAETTSYIITWIGIESVSNSNVICWLDCNTVQPAVSYEGETNLNTTYPSNVVVESYDDDDSAYIFSTFPLKAKLKLTANENWYPKIHSGWFFDDIEEYYLYANRGRETTTSTTYVLRDGPNRQGAPIIVTDNTGTNYLRQVHFWNMSGATPAVTTTNTETVTGNGTAYLYAAYDNIYNITVTDTTIDSVVSLVSNTTTSNMVYLATISNFDHNYNVTYKVRQSYVVDNDYLNGATPSSRVLFDAVPGAYSYSSYVVNYEKSKYDPATPIPVPLNTLHTDFSEGFLYIDHDVYPLQRIELKISPSQVLAADNDYLLVTVETYDQFGNPKPNIDVELFTNFGILSSDTVTTDRDGRAHVILDSQTWNDATPFDPDPATPSLATPNANSYPQGLILAESGAVNVVGAFDIHRVKPPKNNIVAIMEADHILCNGGSSTSVLGRLLDPNRQPIASANIYWRKARTVYELFNYVNWSSSAATPGPVGIHGRVVTDAQGRFKIGPFVSRYESGYWLVSVEHGATPSPDLVGDIVYWYEYPDVTISIDPVTGLPPYPIQRSTPSWEIPNYTFGSVFPVTVDEEDFFAGEASTPSIQWNPPIWYAIDKYKQYHMGLSALEGYFNNDNYGDGFDYATPSYPDYKEI